MTKESATKYVIFDTDMGSDDAWALQMILKAERNMKNVKILAITTVHGNTTTENAIKNTYRILDGLDRTDIPIYRGASESLIPGDSQVGNFHGINGFGDVEFWHPDVYPSDINTLIPPQRSAEIIKDLVMKHPQKISLICLGPLTNIALAIKTYPEIKENIGEVFIMGGNVKGVGNTTSSAEFNFYMDPEAAYIVLNSLSCPITIVPWECCTADAIHIPLEWRFNVMINENCRNCKLLNEIDKIIYGRVNKNIFNPCDAFLTAVFLFPEKCVRAKQQYHATIELHGHYTRGQMVLDHIRKNDHNVTIVEALDEEEFKNILLWTATS